MHNDCSTQCNPSVWRRSHCGDHCGLFKLFISQKGMGNFPLLSPFEVISNHPIETSYKQHL